MLPHLVLGIGIALLLNELTKKKESKDGSSKEVSDNGSGGDGDNGSRQSSSTIEIRHRVVNDSPVISDIKGGNLETTHSNGVGNAGSDDDSEEATDDE